MSHQIYGVGHLIMANDGFGYEWECPDVFIITSKNKVNIILTPYLLLAIQ